MIIIIISNTMTTNTNTTSTKTHLNLVICGHVDSGKSTTTGHLLYKLGTFDERERAKLQAIADANGKGSFAYAYFTDTRKDERERGVTIDCTTKEFFTDKYHYSLVDAPGHRDYVKNMIAGSSTADVAILMIPAELGGFEAAVAGGNRETGEVEGQTHQHCQLTQLMGIKQIIVCVNKMDDKSVNFSESRFNEIKSEAARMLASSGYGQGKVEKVLERIPFIPISGLNGYNLFGEKAPEMPWYNGFKVKNTAPDGSEIEFEGTTLYDALDKFIQVPKRELSKPFRMPIGDILKIPGVGTVITGRIEAGSVKKGDKLTFIPGDGSGKVTARVFSIEMHHRNVDVAGAGDNVGINVKDVEGKIVKGDIALPFSATEKRNPAIRFTAQVVVQDHPGQLKKGFAPVIFIRTARAAYKIVEIKWKMGVKSTNKVKVENPEFVEYKDQAEIVFEAPKGSKQIYMEKFSECEGLGRVIIMDSNALVMIGKIIDVEYGTGKEEDKKDTKDKDLKAVKTTTVKGTKAAAATK